MITGQLKNIKIKILIKNIKFKNIKTEENKKVLVILNSALKNGFFNINSHNK